MGRLEPFLASRHFNTNISGSQISGKTIGIFGFGRIGVAVANRFKGFNVKEIMYCNRSPKNGIDPAYKKVDFDTLTRESDILIITSSLNPETKDIFNLDIFKKMKSSSFIINSSRGGLIKQDDLVTALEGKLIAGAALDVTTPEPLPTTSKLLKMKNVVVLPHIGSATTETRNLMGNLALDNMLLGIEGKALLEEL